MAAYTGTISHAGKAGETGQQFECIGSYALTGALVNADTITWPNLLPKAKAKVVSFEFWAPELDTSASPTAVATIGDGTDADGYITTFNLGLPAVAPANGQQIIAKGNGAIIGTTTQAGRDVVFTVTGVVATGATSGILWVRAVLEGI